jgi:hypothetical protein
MSPAAVPSIQTKMLWTALQPCRHIHPVAEDVVLPRDHVHRPGAMIGAVLVLLILGGFLSIKAYSRD